MEVLGIHRVPKSKYVDDVRWVSAVSPFDRYVVMALHDYDSDDSSVEIHSCSPLLQLQLQLHSSWSSPSRVSSLRVSQSSPLIAASTLEGSLHFLSGLSLDSDLSLSHTSFHTGPISAIDLLSLGGSHCVSAGLDGRLNLVHLADSRLSYRRVFDTQGLASFTAAKWASPSEFATGGLGFTLHWWDHRKPGAAVSHFNPAWNGANTSGIIHSIDIHESRKHVCVAGGSLGTVFAWDLRWQQQPVLLSGTVTREMAAHSPSESEVWEIQYDCYKQSTNSSNTSSAHILPVLACSEDGILAHIEQGEEPIEILAEPCAINSLDINPQKPSDVICSLEWESVALITRQ